MLTSNSICLRIFPSCLSFVLCLRVRAGCISRVLRHPYWNRSFFWDSWDVQGLIPFPPRGILGALPPGVRGILGPGPFPPLLPLLRPPLPPPSFFIRKQLAADRALQLLESRKKKKVKKSSAEEPPPAKKKEKLLQEWMTPELLELIRERDKRQLKIKKKVKSCLTATELEEARREFKVFRNEVTTKIRSAKAAAGILTRKMKPPKVKDEEEDAAVAEGNTLESEGGEDVVKKEIDDVEVKEEVEEVETLETVGVDDEQREVERDEEVERSFGEMCD